MEKEWQQKYGKPAVMQSSPQPEASKPPEWNPPSVTVGNLTYDLVFRPWTTNRLRTPRIASSYPSRDPNPPQYIVVTFAVSNNGNEPVTVPTPTLIDRKGAVYEQASECYTASDTISGFTRINPHELKAAAAAFSVGVFPDPADFSIVFGAPGYPPQKVPLN